MRLSIKKKLVYFCTIIISLTIVLIVAILGTKEYQRTIKNTKSNMKSNMQLVCECVDTFFYSAASNLTMLASHPVVMAADDTITNYSKRLTPLMTNLQDISPKERAVALEFKYMKESNSNYLEVFFGNKSGAFATSNNYELAGGFDPTTRSWYKAAMQKEGKPQLSVAYQSTVGDTVVSIAKTVNIPNDMKETPGVVGIEISLKSLTGLLSSFSIGDTGYIALLQEDGTILAEPHHKEFNFQNIKSLGEKGLENILNVGEELSLVKVANTKYFTSTFSLDRMQSEVPLKWKLVAFMPKNEAMQGFYSMLLWLVIIGVSLMLIFCIISYIFALKLTVPLEKMNKLLEKNDCTVRLCEAGNDEISDLAKNFNIMFDTIKNTVNNIDVSQSKLQDVKDALNDKAQGVKLSISTITQNINGTVDNIHLIDDSTGRIAKEFNILVENTNNAQKLEIEVNENVKQVASASSDLQKTNDIIASIANQTNLLAMNASIEASHAGEHGKGFAVVAVEIRKLAETSSEQSKEVAQKLDNIFNKINLVVSQSNKLEDYFTHLNEHLSLQSTRHSRKKDSKDKQAQAISIASETQNLSLLAKQIQDAMDGVCNNLENMELLGENLEDATGKLNTCVKDINTQISAFTV